MADPRVALAVTGLGVVSPLGTGAAAFWQALSAGASGIGPLPDAGDAVPRLGAPVTDAAWRDRKLDPKLRRADRLSQWVAACARLALEDAGIEADAVPPDRLAVVVGSAFGNLKDSMTYLERLYTKGPSLASPLAFSNLVLNAPASYGAMELGATGANLTVSQDELSGEQALAAAATLLRAGRADVVVAGGVDEIARPAIIGYARFRALSSQRGGPEWCSPYDERRNGLVLGEGAAMLVLETTEHAKRRGVRPYAELDGVSCFAVSAPPYDWPAAAPAAVARVRECVAGTPVDVVFGSANSSRRLDTCELDVLGAAFGDAAVGLPVTSIKGATGEFGAAGALTAAAACLALRHGVVPPLCHLRDPLPGTRCLLSQRALTRPLRSALMLSLARGGAVAALPFRRPQS